MSTSGIRRFRNVIEEAIPAKPDLTKSSADTFRGDAAAILESLVAELSEDAIRGALDHQGFKGKAYLSAIRALAAVAKERRSLRRKPKS
jgi:hypothetical protein